MQALTSVVLAAFVAFAGAWFAGMVEANFALLLFLASVITGVYWLGEQFIFAPARLRAAEQLESDDAQRRSALALQGIKQVDGDVAQAKATLLSQPWWLEWTAGLFPVIVTVFLLRSFLFEPFKIPSGSMIPTLLVGDLILVNKYHYGLRVPVINTKITEGSKPERGDVMVFRYPPQPSLDYIKRVVGVPGDTVAYLNKRLTINGQVVETSALPDFLDEDSMRYFKQFEEKLGDKPHRLLNDANRPAFVQVQPNFFGAEGCSYTVEGVTCKVPEGHYFMMGDNRDNSLDSRYWGFVPDANIVGKAFFVWMNFSSLKRIGGFN
jgi:signal peptidase I